MKRMYMHLLDGQPAFFDGNQVCFMRRGRYGRENQVLVGSLDQIKAEQKHSRHWRDDRGFTDMADDYGYCIVGVP